LRIQDIFKTIKQYPTHTFYKYNNYNEKIKINNNIVLNTKFICHRINTIQELADIPAQFGIELDIRDDLDGTLILSHDPFTNGENFENFLQYYQHAFIILNIKSELVELKCLELMERFNIVDYFFLDSSFPMIYLLNKEYKNNKIACRFSEFEPLDHFIQCKEMYSYLWVDCFTKFPLTREIYDKIKKGNTKICLVSPELQKQPNKILEYKIIFETFKIVSDMICCKWYNIIHWI
jgi:hypothetical protein